MVRLNYIHHDFVFINCVSRQSHFSNSFIIIRPNFIKIHVSVINLEIILVVTKIPERFVLTHPGSPVHIRTAFAGDRIHRFCHLAYCR